MKWAIAGRRQGALDEVKEACLAVTTDNKLSNEFRTIIADSNDEASLRALCNQTRVIVSTAGPFAKFGSLLVKVCAGKSYYYAIAKYCSITVDYY